MLKICLCKYLKLGLIVMLNVMFLSIFVVFFNKLISQVAQARNMRIGEHRYCCITFKIFFRPWDHCNWLTAVVVFLPN